MMANGLMVESFLLPLALFLLFPNPNADQFLTVPDTNFSMRCMWMLPLEIVVLLVASVMPSFWLIEPLGIIGLLVSKLSPKNAFFRHFAFSGPLTAP